MEGRKRRKRMRRIHLLSAVVGRRNNWLLSPGKFPDQFLFMIDKNRKLFSSTEQEHETAGGGARREEELRQQAEGGVAGSGGTGRLASHVTDGGSRHQRL